MSVNEQNNHEFHVETEKLRFVGIYVLTFMVEMTMYWNGFNISQIAFELLEKFSNKISLLQLLCPLQNSSINIIQKIKVHPSDGNSYYDTLLQYQIFSKPEKVSQQATFWE